MGAVGGARAPAVSETLARQRCATHAHREAVSRCPACRRYYCRECVTEHAGRLLCVQCLPGRTDGAAGPPGTRWAVWTAAALLGLFAAFLLFYTAGHLMQRLPASWTLGEEEG